MKTLKLFSLLALVVWVSSCTDTRYVTSGASYEDDEVYYQRGETFITDLQVIDVPVEDDYVNEERSSYSSEDEYYTEQDADVINNYYGSNWNLGANYGLVNPAGSFWTWHPVWGWRISYNWGWGSVGFGNTWGNAWGNPWMCDPWYCDPWFYNPYVYNPWGWNNGWGWGYNYGYGNWAYNPYCYYGNPYYNGGGWTDGGWGSGGNGTYYGHHDQISTGSTVNSGYTGGALFSDRVLKPTRPDGKPDITGEQVTDMLMKKPIVEKDRPGTDLSAGTDDRLDAGQLSKPVLSRPAITIPESSTREEDYFVPRDKPSRDHSDRPSAGSDKPASRPLNPPSGTQKPKSRDRSESAPSPSSKPSSPSREDRKPSISPPSGGGSSPSRNSGSNSGSSSSGGRGSGSTGGSSGGGKKR